MYSNGKKLIEFSVNSCITFVNILIIYKYYVTFHICIKECLSPLQKHSAAADIASTLSEDQVPEAFLVMLLIQFSTMIIDRALYLRKAVLGKLIFQVQLMFSEY